MDTLLLSRIARPLAAMAVLASGCALDANQGAADTPDTEYPELASVGQAVASTSEYAWVRYQSGGSRTIVGGAGPRHFNSTGGLINFFGDGGAYDVDLSDFGELSSNVQVTAVGSGATRCNVSSLASSGYLRKIGISCTDPSTNSLKASEFVLSLHHAGASDIGAYLLANKPSQTSSYWAADSWNSSGAGNYVARKAAGLYVAALPGAYRGDGSYGNLMVTAVGERGHYCKVLGEQFTSSTFYVYVGCFNAAGTPSDSQFSLSLANRAAPFADQRGGYAAVPADATTTVQSASWALAYDTSGTLPTYQRYSTSVKGSYNVRFRSHDIDGSPVLHAVAFGGDNSYCKLASWVGDATFGINARTRCYTPTGSAVDAGFETRLMVHDPIIQ